MREEMQTHIPQINEISWKLGPAGAQDDPRRSQGDPKDARTQYGRTSLVGGRRPRCFPGSVLERFWGNFGYPFGVFLGIFWELKSKKFVVSFFIGFGVPLDAFWAPNCFHLGARGGTGGEKARLQKSLFYLSKTMVFEVWGARARTQIDAKTCSEKVLNIMRFCFDFLLF